MRFVLTWLILAALWIGLSGHFDAIHLTWGLAAVTLVSALSARHLFHDTKLAAGSAALFRLFGYLPWLFKQITLANIDVLLRVIGKRPVEPVLIRFRPELESEFGRVTLANSITLTPGTVTVEIEEDDAFLVHAVGSDSAEGTLTGGMTQRVRTVEGSP